MPLADAATLAVKTALESNGVPLTPSAISRLATMGNGIAPMRGLSGDVKTPRSESLLCGCELGSAKVAYGSCAGLRALHWNDRFRLKPTVAVSLAPTPFWQRTLPSGAS